MLTNSSDSVEFKLKLLLKLLIKKKILYYFAVLLFTFLSIFFVFREFMPEVTTFSTKLFILSKVYIIIDGGGINYLYHCLSACMGDNSLAKACGLSPPTGG